jgi:hypothetical protein
MPSLSRRNLLGLSALGFSTALAGCIQSDVTTDTSTPSQTTTSTMSIEDGHAGPANFCSGEYSSFNPLWVVQDSSQLAGFDLTLDPRTLTFGDMLRVSLRNVTDDTLYSGNIGKYDVQYRGSDGWHTIFGKIDHLSWTDEAILHKPNHGFTWEFPFTQDGLSNVVDNGYGVCAPLNPGTYRFVYWGITTEREENEDYETNYALGVPFTVTDD